MFTPFYNKLLRKYIVTFGNLFNNITMVRYEQDGVTEVDRIKVPISFAPKEKFLSKITEDLDLNRNVQTILPRMAFDIVGITYDPIRKQETNLKRKHSIPGFTNRIASTYVDTPYDLSFELSILVRNFDDGLQIVEQILPYFAPQFSVSVNLDSNYTDEFRTLPITLNSVNQSVDYEGNYESTRSIVWTLSFTMKAWFFGPKSTQNTINTAITNVYDSSSKLSLLSDKLILNMANVGNTYYRYGDLVYQGLNQADATAVGTVLDWEVPANRLTIKVLGGSYKANTIVWALDSNGSAYVSSFYVPDNKVLTIIVTPDPIGSNVDTFSGYNTIIREYPQAN